MIDIMNTVKGYKSPIEVAMEQMRMEHEKRLEGDVFSAIQSYGITVDRDELIKALQYDRKQYECGYVAGRRASVLDVFTQIEQRIQHLRKYRMVNEPLDYVFYVLEYAKAEVMEDEY